MPRNRGPFEGLTVTIRTAMGTTHRAGGGRILPKGDTMSNAQEQLVAALRAIVAESADPHAVVEDALKDVERETSARARQMGDAAPGPYTPCSWSMYVPQAH